VTGSVVDARTSIVNEWFPVASVIDMRHPDRCSRFAFLRGATSCWPTRGAVSSSPPTRVRIEGRSCLSGASTASDSSAHTTAGSSRLTDGA